MRAGEAGAIERLLPLVYAELHELAVRQMGRNRRDHTLQPTALVHELYLRLAHNDGGFDDSKRFMAVAATAMRQILVDHARKRSAAKRGGAHDSVTIDDVAAIAPAGVDVLDLEAALTALEAEHPRPAKVAELRFYAGLSVDDVAAALEVSARTVDYDWRFARAWLQRALSGPRGPAPRE